MDYVTALRALQYDLEQRSNRDTDYDIPYSTVHVGQIRSGTALNIVPDSAEVLFEFRHLAEDDPEDLAHRVFQAADAVTAPHAQAASIELRPLAAYPGLATPPTQAAVAMARDWSGAQTCKVAFGTEAGFLSDLRIPTVVCGPGSMAEQGHKPDEYVTQLQLFKCAQMLENAVAKLL